MRKFVPALLFAILMWLTTGAPVAAQDPLPTAFTATLTSTPRPLTFATNTPFSSDDATGTATALFGTVSPTSPATDAATAASTATIIFTASPTVTPLTNQTDDEADGDESETGVTAFTFNEVGVEDTVLRGPFDTLSYTIALPPDWALSEGVEVSLQIESYLDAGVALGGLLEISFNRIPLDSIPLDWNGSRTIVLTIPPEAFASPRDDGRFEFRADLTTGLACNAETQPDAIILGSSSFVMPYEVVPVLLNLSRYPQPIYMDSIDPAADAAAVIVPSEPTANELQAALTVTAGLGSLSFNRVVTSFFTEDQLPDDLRDTTHLIFVGQPDRFESLAEVDLPQPQNEVDENDGLLRVVVSPWNDARAAFVVSGQTDLALNKAAQTLTTRTIVTDSRDDVAIISNLPPVRPSDQPRTDPLNLTLLEAGYEAEVMNSPGRNAVSYTFFVPPGRAVSGESYFDLIFNHSALLNYEQSSLAVRLNGTPVGSARLSDDTTDITSVRMSLPVSTLQAGYNTLEIVTQLVPQSGCLDLDGDSLWLVVQPESALTIDLQSLEEASSIAYELNDYPQPFTYAPDLSTTAFVLPQDDLIAWQAAAILAFDLGNRGRGIPLRPAAAFSDAVPQDMRETRNLIVVGRSSNQPFLGELGGLPLPSQPDTDLPALDLVEIPLRLQPGDTVGYLQLLPSPDSPDTIILAVLGAGENGPLLAASAFIDGDLRNDLWGDVAAVYGEQVVANDTRELDIDNRVAQLQPESTAEATAEPEPEATAEPDEPLRPSANNNTAPGWVVPVVAASGAIMGLTILAVVMSAYWTRRRRRRVNRRS